MPLDFGQPRLADLASWVGIRPVPNEVLAEHMRREVAKRPGSWMYRHPLATTIGMLCAFLSGVVGAGSFLAYAVFGGSGIDARLEACVIAISLTFGTMLVSQSRAFSRDGLRVYGPATWETVRLPVPDGCENVIMLLDIPASIKNKAIKILHHSTGDMSLVYGELVQDSKVVDPYLAICRGDEQIVIGIWDEFRIIHEATEQDYAGESL